MTSPLPRLASRIGVWSVLEKTTFSDHQCIEFNLEQRHQAVDKGRGSEGRCPSWNSRRFCRERLTVHLETTRLINELGWVEPAGCWRTLCDRRGKMLSQLATTRCPAPSAGKPGARCTGGMTSWPPYVENASKRGGDSLHEAWKRAKAALG